MILLDSAALPPPVLLSEEGWSKIRALDWNTTYSRRVREGTGDDGLRVAFDPERGCWVVATLRKVQVTKHFGVQRIADTEVVPWVWGEWREDPTDPDTAPLSIEDPRLIPWIQKSSLVRTGPEKFLADVELARLKKDRDLRNSVIEQRASDDVFQAMRVVAARDGITAHRKTGPSAKKITSAGLWRSGAGAKPATGSIILASA